MKSSITLEEREQLRQIKNKSRALFKELDKLEREMKVIVGEDEDGNWSFDYLWNDDDDIDVFLQRVHIKVVPITHSL